jgi:hypothetical protein
MLHLSTWQLAIVGLAGFVSGDSNVCKQFPYAQLAFFGRLPEVQSFCSAKFPLDRCTTTSTTTAHTTVPTTVATVTKFTGNPSGFEDYWD